MRRLVSGVLILGACAALTPGIALARPPYRMAFLKNYEIKEGSNLAKAQCNVCHMGADKTVRNPYGVALEKALGKTRAAPEEATAALKKIEGMVSGDKKSKYVELIKADKLPGDAKAAE